MAMTKTLSMISRTGRDLQRYNDGCRQVVGCIPYRYRKTNQLSTVQRTQIDDLEFLLISSQKSPRWMFPKGGWETDEALEDAALRETFEESGVIGEVEVQEFLGTWSFKSKSQGTFHEGHMFPLLVTDELDDWPEKTVRKRLWLKFSEAREVCWHSWMKEALDVFASKLTKRNKEEEEPRTCAFDELSYEQTIAAVSNSNPMFCEEPRISNEANDLNCEELRISLVAKPSVGKLMFNQESRTKPLFNEISNVANSMFSEEATMSTKAQKMFNEELGNSHVTPMFGEGKRISIAAFS
ncbi:PREDICTED: nudix hydrolase 18, mitochondrial-like [Nicotiana attenuata]|uniref:Nudix hydrolase 17, mitochondrial n=1 Tax=Nicotiana attenuata TaxID=49451 RepID=A0A1J6JW14_NICAT|nr:PREDICTED: nudix hydrolase 18, mitochondrial-like [Nicotiana attenuata]OIT21933.1 nudix hydrolase 17, mitochondrial [Nicotiana attenuata]